jgi:hypothetical protein
MLMRFSCSFCIHAVSSPLPTFLLTTTLCRPDSSPPTSSAHSHLSSVADAAMTFASAASSAVPALTTTRGGFAPIPTQRHTDYTTRYRCRDEDDDYAVHTHANGISVLTLAPTHPIRRLQKTVTESQSHARECRSFVEYPDAYSPLPGFVLSTAVVSWHGTSQTDRSQTKVTGKRKKGGFLLEPNSLLCKITVSEHAESLLGASSP